MSKIIFVSSMNKAQDLLTEAFVRYYHRADTIETVDASDKAGLTAAILGLTAAQDFAYFAGTISDTGSFLTDTQATAIKAKLDTGTHFLNWTLVVGGATRNMAFQAWDALFGASSAVPLVLFYTSETDAKRTPTEERYGAYLDYAIKARWFGEMTTQASLETFWSVIDKGFMTNSNFNPAYSTNSPSIIVDTYLLADLLTEGLDFYNYNADASADKDFLSFTMAEQSGAGTIKTSEKTIAITVANGTSPTALVGIFTLSDGASAYIADVAQVSSTTANNFTSPLVYVVVAADGTIKSYTATVTIA